MCNYLVPKCPVCGARLPLIARTPTHPLRVFRLSKHRLYWYSGASPPLEFGISPLHPLVILDRLRGNLSGTCLLSAAACARVWEDLGCLSFTFLTLALGLCPSAYEGLGAWRGRSRGIFTISFVACPQTSVFCKCGRACARPGAKSCTSPIPEPILAAPCRRPQRRGVCVCPRVFARGQRVSPRTPCARGRGCLCGLRDPRSLGGTPGRAWLQPHGSPGSANLQGPKIETPGRRGQVQGFSASWAASLGTRGAALPPELGDAWSAPGEVARSPRPGRRAEETPTTRLSLLSPHLDSAPPSQIKTPSPVSPAHISAPFPNPGRSASTQSWEGEDGSEARAIIKPPNLPAISQIPGSCADYMAQEQDGFKS